MAPERKALQSLTALVRPALVIAILSLFSSLPANLLRSRPLAWDWRPTGASIPAETRVLDDFGELDRLLADPSVVVVDARDPRLFKLGTLPRAVSLPAEEAETLAGPFLESLPEAAPILLFCSDPHCPLAERLAKSFSELGRGDLAIFRPGCDGWLEAGRPAAGTP